MEEAKGKPYDGNPAIARESQWLNSEDVPPGKDAKVKVQAVMLYNNVKLQGDKGPASTKKNLLTLRFHNKERELIVNRTIAKVMSNMFGVRTGGWVDKEITIYQTQCQSFGKTVDCLRVRDKGSRPATAAEQLLHEDEGSGDVETTGPGQSVGDAAEPIEGNSQDSSPLFSTTPPSARQ